MSSKSIIQAASSPHYRAVSALPRITLVSLEHLKLIGGKTRTLGLLGRSITHTLSPSIHNYAIERFGLDQVYLPLDVEVTSQEEMKSLLNWLWKLGVQGLNVTVPYKELVASVTNTRLASVNTLYRGEDFWLASSTDADGFLDGLEDICPAEQLHFDRLILIGNGGAALALALHLVEKLGLQRVDVLRRSGAKDESWKAHFHSFEGFNVHELSAPALSTLLAQSQNERLLVVQASSAPLSGDRLDYLLPGMCLFDGVFVDLVYGKSCSLLLEWSKTAGIPAQDGLAMLAGQALRSQQLWWGKSLQLSETLAILKQTSKEG